MTNMPIEIDSIVKKRLTNTHMALVRGWVQGIELGDLAERYLAGIGEDEQGVDLRVAKTSLMWILDDLAALAKRAGIAGGVTLRRQASRIRLEPNAPTLDDFAQTLDDPDFYSETELVTLYQDTYGGSGNSAARGEARRSRLITRQLNLLTDLTHHLTAAMTLRDYIDSWFEDNIARRLEVGGLRTIEDLAFEITRRPDNWFDSIQGIGAGKAQRIARFLEAQLGDLGDALGVAGIHVPLQVAPIDRTFNFQSIVESLPALPSPELPTNLPSMTDEDLALVSKGQLNPSDFDGSHGRLRSRTGQSATSAKNDGQALESWLSSKRSDKTKTLYRREIQRVIAWAITVKRCPLTSLSTEDATDYKNFLLDIPDDWIGRKGPGNLSVAGQWRAFAGSLTESSANKSLSIIHAFFGWMMKTNYCVANPFVGVKVVSALPSFEDQSTSADDLTTLELAEKKEQSVVTRTLPYAAIKAIELELEMAPQDEFIARARFVFRFAISTGMRISELALARRKSLTRHEPTATEPGFWELSVLGKRAKPRKIPLPDSLVKALVDYLDHRGLGGSLASVPEGTFLIGRFPSDVPSPTKAVEKPIFPGDGVRPETIHRTLVTLFKRAAKRLSEDDLESAKRLQVASAHWLRHTCATDAVAAEVPLDVVASTLGHTNLQTTSKYVHTEDRRRAKEMRKYWEKATN